MLKIDFYINNIMKSKDQILIGDAYLKIVAEKTQELTPQQEHVYSRYRSFDWEFDRWEGDDVIMVRWDRGYDSSMRLAELVIKPDGEHFRVKKEDL